MLSQSELNNTSNSTLQSSSNDFFSLVLLNPPQHPFVIIPFIYFLFGILWIGSRVCYLRSVLKIYEINQSLFPMMIGFIYLPASLLSSFYLFYKNSKDLSNTELISSLNNYSIDIFKYFMSSSLLYFGFLYSILNSKPKRSPDDMSIQHIEYNDNEKWFQRISFVAVAVAYAFVSTLFRYDHLKIYATCLTLFTLIACIGMNWRVLNSSEIYGIEPDKKLREDVVEEFINTKKKLFIRMLAVMIPLLSVLVSNFGMFYQIEKLSTSVAIHILFALLYHSIFVFQFYNFYFQKDVLDQRRNRMKVFFLLFIFPIPYYDSIKKNPHTQAERSSTGDVQVIENNSTTDKH
ncbi:hypothetical protein C9374_010455 [Naegleria lovaniensis]|uniref:Uncharacterized protein n=1 Tax=Naegleria lovaniensis TaxID=51637 RepID=A0AA88GDV8_NAELO|nr:uncharacterized protein C9374_010455 [Naegleria lovaniensis]KAG2374711.1 hypothetical protein C9374_010455 [Naegleria lovaniensis]